MSAKDQGSLDTLQRLYEYEAEFEAQSAALREAYQELTHSRDRYRSLFEESPVAFVVIDVDTRIHEVNSLAEALLEADRERLLRSTLMSRISPVHHVSLRSNLDIALMRGRSTTSVARLAGEDLETWVRIDTGRLELQGERRLLVVLHDITRQYLAEDALRTSEARFRALFECSSDAVALLDGASLTLQEVNPAFVRLTSESPEELVGARLRGLFPEDQRWAVSATLRQALHRGEAGPLSVTLARESGDRRRIELSATAVRVGGGLFAMVTLRDVHEQWLSVQRRRAAERQLWQVQRVEMVGAMASGMAQDVANSLAAVEALAKQGLDGDPTEALEKILEAARLGRSLSHQVQGLGRQPAPEERFDLSVVLRNAVSLARSGSDVAVDTRVEVPDGLWMLGDPGPVGQAVVNVLRNAMQASEDHGEVRLFAATQRLGERAIGELPAGCYVRLRIEDDGGGMAEDVLTHAFEPFYSTRPRGKGSGLGLSTARATIEEHGGLIDLDSHLGEGTWVDIWLPLAAGEDGMEPREAPFEASVHRLAVIDPDEMVRRATARMLSADGYRVESIDLHDEESLVEGLASDMSAVLLDVGTLERLDEPRLAVLERLSTRQPQPVLVAMTTHAAGHVSPELAEPFDAVLHKPFGPADMRRILLDLDRART